MSRSPLTTLSKYLEEHEALVATLPEGVSHPQKLWIVVSNATGNAEPIVDSAVVKGDYVKCLHNEVKDYEPVSENDLKVEQTPDGAGRCMGVRCNVVRKNFNSQEEFETEEWMSRMFISSFTNDPQHAKVAEEMMESSLFVPYDSTNVQCIEHDPTFRGLLEQTVRDVLPLLVHYMHPDELAGLEPNEDELVKNAASRFSVMISWRQPDVLPAQGAKSWFLDVGIVGWFCEFTEFDEEGSKAFISDHPVALPLVPEMVEFLKRNVEAMTDKMLDDAFCGDKWRKWPVVRRPRDCAQAQHFYKTLIDKAFSA